MRLRWPWRGRHGTPTPEDAQRLADAQRKVAEKRQQVAEQTRQTQELGRYFRDQGERNHLVDRLRDALGGG